MVTKKKSSTAKTASPVITATSAKKSVAPSAEAETTAKKKTVPKKDIPVKAEKKTQCSDQPKDEVQSIACSVSVSKCCSNKPMLEHSAIARRAWEIWQCEGCPEGRDLEHWLQAERELRS